MVLVPVREYDTQHLLPFCSKHICLTEGFGNRCKQTVLLQLTYGSLQVKIWYQIVFNTKIRKLIAGHFYIKALNAIQHNKLILVGLIVEKTAHFLLLSAEQTIKFPPEKQAFCL